MSLYRYVPGKSELLDLMLEAALDEEPPADLAAPWRAQLEHFAREGMKLYLRHPWMLGISVNRPPLGPNTIGNWDAMLQAVTGIGLTGPEMIAATTAVGSYLRGAAQSAVEAQQARQGESDEEWWGARMTFWEDFFEPERFPGLTARVGERRVRGPARDDFEFGLARAARRDRGVPGPRARFATIGGMSLSLGTGPLAGQPGGAFNFDLSGRRRTGSSSPTTGAGCAR